VKIKSFANIIFIIWVLGVAVMATIPRSDDNLIVRSDLSNSGMEKHIVGYFVGALLFYYAYRKRGSGFRKDIYFMFLSGLLIFGYSVVLEIVQLYLPYRTFNLYDTPYVKVVVT